MPRAVGSMVPRVPPRLVKWGHFVNPSGICLPSNSARARVSSPKRFSSAALPPETLWAIEYRKICRAPQKEYPGVKVHPGRCVQSRRDAGRQEGHDVRFHRLRRPLAQLPRPSASPMSRILLNRIPAGRPIMQITYGPRSPSSAWPGATTRWNATASSCATFLPRICGSTSAPGRAESSKGDHDDCEDTRLRRLRALRRLQVRKTADVAQKSLALHGAEVARISLMDYPLPPHGPGSGGGKKASRKCGEARRADRRHDGLLIASPEYNASIPPLLKNTIDWVSRIRQDGDGNRLAPFSGKVAGLCSSSDGNLRGDKGTLSPACRLDELPGLRSLRLNAPWPGPVTPSTADGNFKGGTGADDDGTGVHDTHRTGPPVVEEDR